MMLATRDEAEISFSKYVDYAQGDSFLVYKALSQKRIPTDKDVKEYIDKELKRRGKL